MSNWRHGLKEDLTGRNAHRTWIVVVTTFVAAYFGIYAIFEARHDRQMQMALYERNSFITMVSSGNRGQFIAAMRNFRLVQNFSISRAPPILKPWEWYGKETPNREPLRRWAKHRLRLCTPAECGDEKNDIRIDLRGVRLDGAHLSSVDLRRADFTDGNLAGANLTDSILCNARLNNVILTNAVLDNADILSADFSDAVTRVALGCHT